MWQQGSEREPAAARDGTNGYPNEAYSAEDCRIAKPFLPSDPTPYEISEAGRLAQPENTALREPRTTYYCHKTPALSDEGTTLNIPDDNDASDTTVAVAKGILSLIPGGGVVAEMIGLAVSKASRERDLKFWGLVAEKLQLLEERVGELTSHGVFEDQQFIAYAHRAMRASQESADDDKRQLLATALVNSGSWSTLAVSELDRFTALVSRYSMLHIKLLTFMKNPEKWLRTNSPTYPSSGIGMTMGGLGSILSQYVFGGDAVYPDEVARVLQELDRDDLISNPGLSTMMSSGLLAPRIKPLGTKFLDFLADPEEIQRTT